MFDMLVVLSVGPEMTEEVHPGATDFINVWADGIPSW